MAIDLTDLRARIIAVRNGTLPASAVTDEELRASIVQLREDRSKRAVASKTSTPTTAKTAVNLTAIQGKKGGLLDMLNNAGE
jgi:hypothetical protein